MRRAALLAALFCLAGVAEPARAQADLDALLREVREGRTADRALAQEREARFIERRDERARLLREARATRDREAQRSESLRLRFEQRERELNALGEKLDDQLGHLGELVSTARQVAGETRAELEVSLISAEFPERADELSALADGSAFPDLERLTALWWAMQHEMTETGRSSRFDAEVALPSGHHENRSVTRIGPFTALSDGRFLHFDGGRLLELARQPARPMRADAREYESTREGLAGAVIDPSRGALLALLVDAPTFRERVGQGGPIGLIIGVVGLVGLILAVLRAFYLSGAARGIRRQLQADTPSDGNALGRILACANVHSGASAEALELHLEEAIAREAPPLERGLSTLRVLTIVAPLLGLLGTVTGMIETFQMITLFGAGDPKIMAGGISEALVTTMLGLGVAIPLTLVHGWLRDRSHGLVEVLEEQSAGLVARRAEAGEGARSG